MCCHVCFISAKINVYYLFCFIFKPSHFVFYIPATPVYGVSPSWSDITELVVSIRISLIKVLLSQKLLVLNQGFLVIIKLELKLSLLKLYWHNDTLSTDFIEISRWARNLLRPLWNVCVTNMTTDSVPFVVITIRPFQSFMAGF